MSPSVHPAPHRSFGRLGDPETVRFVNAATVPTNAVAELDLHVAHDLDDPWAELEVDVTFADPAGGKLVVPAYWAGGSMWKVRYCSHLSGTHTYETVVRSLADGSNQAGESGRLDVEPYHGANLLLRHGGPTVADDRRHLMHRDGTPFFWLADTWWSAMTARFRWPEVFQTIADDRATKGFTVAQIVAGLVPELAPFSSATASEGGQLWTDEGKGSINPAFYDVPDLKIDYLVARGIVPCIVGGWGYYADILGADRLRLHWRYLVARYGAYPVVWCLAGEVDIPTLEAMKEATNLDDLITAGPPTERVALWEEVSNYVSTIDPFGRVRTVHPCPSGDEFSFASSEAFSSRTSFDLDMLHTGHTGRNCVPITMEHLRRALEPGDKPVLNGECTYEGIFDSNWQDIQRFLFWSHILSGTAGHTYGTMPISTFNSREDPILPFSRVSMHFWDEAINWLGSTQLGIGKSILEQLTWWDLAPSQDTVDRHAGPDDWFLPYTATTSDGTIVSYFPAVGMEPSSSLFTDSIRLGKFTIDVAKDTSYRAAWVNPRNGRTHVSFSIPASAEPYDLSSDDPGYAMPTGEDWVLILVPADAS